MGARSCAAVPRIFRIPALAWSVVTIAMQPALIQAQLIQPSSGLINPRAIVFSPATKKVYAVDTDHGAIQIYSDSRREMHRVQVGSAPVSIAVNPTNGRVYIANAGDGTVTVLDGNSDAVVATVPIGSHPYSIAVNGATGKIYVTHTFGDQLSILDGATNTPSGLKTGSSDLIAINSRAGIIYLLGYGGAVKVLDDTSQTLTERPVGKHAWGLTVNDVTGAAYVTRIENGDVAALEADSSATASFQAGAIPCAIAVNSKTSTLYVANYGDDTVSVIDAVTGHKTATVAVGHQPKAIAFDANRNLAYAANTSEGTVTVIDATKNVVIATLPAGRNPYALAVVPGSSRLYVANEADDNPSTVIDLDGIHKLNPQTFRGLTTFINAFVH
jgi:YVTN family beta-propeller protein